MKTIKKYLISIGITLGLSLIFVFVINVLNYFDILSKTTYKALLILSSVMATTIGGYILGTKSDKKGYIKGLTLGIIIVALYAIATLISKNNLSIASFIYYLVIIITSSITGAVGINKKITELNQ